MNLLRKFLDWVRSLFKKPSDIGIVRFVESVSEIPDNIDGAAYIVERGGRKIWLVVECPCHVHHRLTVNLSEGKSPRWIVTVKGGRLTVYPSLWIGDECESHFWIRNGEIINAPNQ